MCVVMSAHEKRSDGEARLELSASRVTVPCFAHRTFYMAELGTERERMRSGLEELASV